MDAIAEQDGLTPAGECYADPAPFSLDAAYAWRLASNNAPVSKISPARVNTSLPLDFRCPPDHPDIRLLKSVLPAED